MLKNLLFVALRNFKRDKGYSLFNIIGLTIGKDWLQKYDYKITIGPGVFFMAALMALLITLITISFQAIKAAMANPVKSLGTE